jgi:hypothetical protein
MILSRALIFRLNVDHVRALLQDHEGWALYEVRKYSANKPRVLPETRAVIH